MAATDQHEQEGISDSTPQASRFPAPLRGDAGLIATALIAAGGLALGGFLLGDGLPRAKRSERAVTVRGVAERDVRADLAVWSLSFDGNAPDLASAQAQADANADAIRGFFREQGFPADALTTTGVNVSRESENKQVRYVVRQRMTLRTKDVGRAETAGHNQFELVRRGVFLESGSRLAFIYTGLNRIKPDMVAQATKDARGSAEQFARDSGSNLGGIRNATQGYFEVSARAGDASEGWGDAETPNKTVRVVTTVNYLLK